MQFISLFLCAFSSRITACATLNSTLSQTYITYLILLPLSELLKSPENIEDSFYLQLGLTNQGAFVITNTFNIKIFSTMVKSCKTTWIINFYTSFDAVIIFLKDYLMQNFREEQLPFKSVLFTISRLKKIWAWFCDVFNVLIPNEWFWFTDLWIKMNLQKASQCYA